MKIRFLYNFLIINDCKEILLPLDIKGLIQLENLVVVFIYATDREEMEGLPRANVFAFNENAEQVWQIEEPPQSEEYEIAYADISLNKKGEVIAGTTVGTEYVVNTIDGSITPVNENKRPW